MGIGDHIKAERERIGLSQQAFAAIGGASKNSQIAWEKEAAHPNAAVLAAWAAAGADVLYIVTGARSQAVAEVELLPQDERALLDAYRACAPEARRHLITSAALLGAGMGAPHGTGAQVSVRQSNRGAIGTQIGHAGGAVTIGGKSAKKSRP